MFTYLNGERSSIRWWNSSNCHNGQPRLKLTHVKRGIQPLGSSSVASLGILDRKLDGTGLEVEQLNHKFEPTWNIRVIEGQLTTLGYDTWPSNLNLILQ